MQSGKRVADVGGGAGLADLPAVLLFVCCLLFAVCGVNWPSKMWATRHLQSCGTHAWPAGFRFGKSKSQISKREMHK